MTSHLDPAHRRRSDARRNRELLVAAAARVFAAQGVDAPLDAVARDAGVGNATMYRNFPTREAMLEAVLHERYQQLASSAEELLAVTPPDAALIAWLGEFVAYSQTFRGLPDPVLATLRDQGSALHDSCETMRIAAARLLVRAQQAGAIRDDIDATDVFTHAAGIAWATQRAPDDPGRTQRLLTVMTDGLRPPQPGSCASRPAAR
jgi:AcrR family transcriptional regulator